MKLGPLRVPKLQSSEFPLSTSFLSLYIGLELGFSIAKISQISFKIKIKINIIYLYSDYEYLKISNKISKDIFSQIIFYHKYL